MENKSCVDVKDESDDIIGAVCVVVSKTHLKRDLIFMLKEGKAISSRSVTELVNILAKHKITFDERKRILNFVSNRLIELIPNL